jgi:hypothetical protein
MARQAHLGAGIQGRDRSSVLVAQQTFHIVSRPEGAAPSFDDLPGTGVTDRWQQRNMR